MIKKKSTSFLKKWQKTACVLGSYQRGSSLLGYQTATMPKCLLSTQRNQFNGLWLNQSLLFTFKKMYLMR